MGNFAENLNLGNRVRPPPDLNDNHLIAPYKQHINKTFFEYLH